MRFGEYLEEKEKVLSPRIYTLKNDLLFMTLTHAGGIKHYVAKAVGKKVK